MTREDIIRMAREAGLTLRGHYDEPGSTPQELERFAVLVAAAEREVCEKICEDVGNRDANTHAWDAAAAIRARGNT